jgi:hypothetical protein
VPEPKTYDEKSPAVQAHLQILQSVIQRMAVNSASCKAWCVSLVSAILVLVAGKGSANYAFIAALPTLLFLALDAYYLGLEKGFIDSYNKFVQQVHLGAVRPDDLFSVQPPSPKVQFSKFIAALQSFSVWPFYVALAALILLVWRFVF